MFKKIDYHLSLMLKVQILCERYSCSNHLNLGMKAECLTKTFSYLKLNLNISPEQKMVETQAVKSVFENTNQAVFSI